MMNENELRKLKRVDLLELLISQGRENEELRHKLAEAEQKLADRQIKTDEAGSIAEAALKLNGVFEAAQAAADQYLENIKRLGGADIKTEKTEKTAETAGAEITEAAADEEKCETGTEAESNTESKETGRSRWMKIKSKSSR